MNEASFRKVLRSVLALTLVSPALATSPSCGGRIDGVSVEPNESPPSSAPTSTSTSTSVPPLPPVDGEDPPPPLPPKDSGALDASKDASKDAPEICGTVVQDNVCSATVENPCHVPEDAGPMDQAKCAQYCPSNDGGPSQAFGCYVSKDADGGRVLYCHYCLIGRRPDGLAPCASAGGDALGAFFADVSRLEAASVDAFERLEHDLDDHGAPASLRMRARRSARDEVRHAKTTASLASLFGARAGAWSDRPRVEPRRARSLEEIAVENATEGCVRETFGALVGMWQAEHAEDDTIRRAMKTIARDESSHAALSWSILEWSLGELDDEARRRVETALQRAAANLARDVVFEPHPDLRARAGMPSASEAASIVAAFQRTIPSFLNPSSTSG